MKICYTIVTFIILLTLFVVISYIKLYTVTSSSAGYHIRGDSVSYIGHCFVYEGDEICIVPQIINAADAQSFVIIDRWYARDKYRVYIDGDIFVNADSSTFRLLGKSESSYAYSLDKNNVYWHGKIVDGIDPNKFEIIDEDKSTAWDGRRLIDKGVVIN